jgi:succinyl-diaminopimelate desuccinylase
MSGIPAPLSDDPVALAQALIRCPSVTPHEGGALTLLEQTLKNIGFDTHRLTFGTAPEGPVENLFARIGTSSPHFCFAGHTDVVPSGALEGWSVDPFAAVIQNGLLIGRGANDMKSAIAAFVVAAAHYIKSGGKGSISFLITGDEEGPALYGTKPVLEWMQANDQIPDHCLVGEPTSAQYLGDMIKIGRRGSLNARITVSGAQGHVAYPHQADNPVTKLVNLLQDLKSQPLDNGADNFQPSNLEITTVDVGNTTENMIPALASARINIRFNTNHSGASLTKWLHDKITLHAPGAEIAVRVSGEPFYTAPGVLSGLLASAITAETSQTPELSTSGGTSDARFIAQYCPVIEFGLVGRTMHKVDEQTSVADIQTLTKIYGRLLHAYFGTAA